MNTIERLAFAQLATNEEIDELRALLVPATMKLKTPGLRLKRTFNMNVPGRGLVRFWRVVGPLGHKSLNSDLSIEGLREWDII